MTTEEDDDDEGFGDFTFATPTHSIPPINGSDHRADLDDDWGDFVNSAALSRSESLPAKSLVPLNSVSDHRVDRSESNVSVLDSAPSRNQAQWVKPKGALPLSLFGEEEADEKGEGSSAAGLLFNGTVDLKTNKGVKEEKKIGSELNVSELISNLYKRNDQSTVENGRKPDANGSGLKLENLSLNGLDFDSNGLDLKRSVSNLDSNGFGLKTNVDLRGLNFDSNGLGLTRSVSNLDSNGFGSKRNFDSSGLNSGLDEDDGWELKGAESKLQGFNFKSPQVKAEHVQIPNLNGLNLSSNVLDSDLSGLNSSFKEVNSGANGFCSSLADKSEDFGDDDEWEFKDAESEAQSGDNNHQVDSRGLGNADGVKNMFDNGAHVSTDFFVAPHKVSQTSGDWDFGLDFSSKSSLTLDGTSTSYSNSKEKNDGESENGLNSALVGGTVANGENIWAFQNAISEDGSKDKANEANLKKDRGALPLSIFGEEELETDDPSVRQDVVTFDLASSRRDDIKKSQGSHVSINDLLSSLYSEAEKNTSINHTQNPNENGLDSVQKVADSNLVDGDGDFDDDSWEFKGAVSRTGDEDRTSVPGLGDSHIKYSPKAVWQKDYADFYFKLEGELWLVAQCHLDNLKKARTSAALAGEGDKLKALDKEIQDLYSELHEDGIISNEAHPENRPLSNICLNEFVEVLQEPKFHMLESEYHLSRRLLLAEKDWRSAIELLKHAASTSKMLKLGSREAQSHYVSTWYKMVSVCAEELRHGALIWKQSSEKKVSSQILSDPRGKQYILALGEIYRAVEVLGSSAKLYRPLVLLSSADPPGIFTLLSECSTLWSSSGLEEAFQNISDPTGINYGAKPKEILESIKYIHDIDAHELHNHVFSEKEPSCRLSLLTAGMVPDMEMVVWNGERYFLPLANLWANLVASDPPNSPHLHVV